MKSYIPYLMIPALCAALSAQAQTTEADFIAVLKKPDASLNEKVKAAHMLGQVGTKAAIAPLAELLGNAELPLAHAARYGLQMIPDPAVDAALRDAAGKLQGLNLMGVLQSLGDRRDAAAVPALAKALGNADKATADAAAQSLGKIATADAASALKPLLGKSDEAARAYLCCGTKNPLLYADVLKAGEALPKSIRLAALRGDRLARGLKLADFESKDPDEVDIALGVALERQKGDELTKATLLDALQKIPLIREQICATLAERGEAIPLPVVRQMLKDGTPKEQIAVMRAVTRVGMAAAIPDIAAIAMAEIPGGVSSEAQLLLGCFPAGPQRTAALNDLLNATDPKRQVAGINVATHIRDAGTVPTLLKLAGGTDVAVSDAAFKAVGTIATLEQFNALLAAFQAKSSSDAALRAVTAFCSRQAQAAGNANIEIRKALYGSKEQNKTADITGKVAAQVKAGGNALRADNSLAGGDPAPNVVKTLYLTYAVEGVEKQVTVKENETVTFEDTGIPPAVRGPLNDAYNQAKGEAKGALLRVYATFENKQSLEIITAAANQDADKALQEAAQRILFDSKSLNALPTLEEILKQPASPDRMKTLALRAYMRLLNNSNMAPGMRIAYLTKLSAALARDEDRKTVKDAIAEDMKLGKDETGFVPMFNGKDLTGWDSQNGWWEMRDGILVAESTPQKRCTKNDHIIWKVATPRDFEIRTDFRLSKSANSGIQLRSEPVADRDTGYQADSNGTGEYVGFLYHPAMHLVGERGACVTIGDANKKDAWRFADSAELQKLYKIEDWNSHRVVCKGQEITIYVNDVLTSHFMDTRSNAPKNGVITLQLHAGEPMKVEFKNTRIRVSD